MPGNTTSTTTFRADISSLRQGMQEARRQISLANSEFRAASSSMEDWTRSADGLNAKLRSLDSVLSAQRRQLNILEQELEATTREYGENSAAADRVRVRINNQTAAINRTEREIRDYQSQLDRLENEADSAAREIDDMNNSIDDTDSSSQKASDGFTVMKGALANLVASGIKVAIQGMKKLADETLEVYKAFDAGRDNVIKATGATGEAAKELVSSYKNVAQNIKGDMETIGGTLGEVNTRFGYTERELENATEKFLKFTDITGTDAVQAVRLVSRAMGDANIDSSEYETVLDELAVAAQASGISLDALAEQITKYGAPMRALGFDTAESIAIFSQWEKAGVNTEIAFSGMKKSISNWGKEGKDAREEFKKTLKEIENTKDIAGATAKAIEVFGQKAGPDLADAIKSGRFSYGEFLKIIENSSGTVEKTYEETQDGFDKIQLGVQAAKVELGNFFNEFLEKYEPQIGNFINNVVDWIKKIVTEISDIEKNGSMNGMIDFFDSITKKIIEKLTEFIPRLVIIAEQTINSFTNRFTELTPKIINIITNTIPLLLSALSNILTNLTNIVPKLLNSIITTVANSAPQISNAISGMANDIIKKIPSILNSIIRMIPTIIVGISHAIEKETSVITNAFFELFDSFKAAVPLILSMLAANLPQIINTVVDFVINAVPELLNASVEMFDAIADAIPEVLPDIIAALLNVITKVAITIVSRLPDIVNASIRMLDGIVRGITQIIPKVIAAMPKIVLAVTESLIEAMPNILEAAKNMLFGVIYAITEIVPTIAQKVEEIDKAVENGIRQGINVIREAGKDLIRGLWYGISDMAGWIKGKVQEFAGGIVDNLKKTLKIQSPSKVIRDEVGYWMAMAIPVGFDKAYSSVTRRLKLIATSLTGGFVSSLISGITLSNQQTVSASKKTASLVEQIMSSAASNFDFAGAAESAASQFSDALNKKVTYLTNRIQYQNEQRLSMFEDDISTLESRLEKETASEEARSQKAIERLEKERDKLISTAEKKQKKAKSEVEKANVKNEIDAVKKRYTKLISAEEKASKKQISSIKRQYETLISEQKKAKDSYEKASAAALQEFDTAMAEYQQNAETLISNTINGISEKYQAEYDALTNKQENLIKKLKSAGDLFSVSSAGVMTINDIRQQTKNIKEYTEKLQKVKEKVSSELFDEISSYDIKEGSAFMERLLTLSDDDLKAYSEAYEEKMRMAESLSESLYDGDFSKLADEYSDSLSEAMEGIPDLLKELGNSAMQGFVDGLSENTDYMVKSVRTIISALVDEIKSGLDMHSPSRVLEKLGVYAGEGFGDGLSSMVRYIRGIAGDIVDAAKIPIEGLDTSLPQLRSALLPTSTSGATSSIVTNNYNLVQNNTSPKSLSALETYQARRQQLAMLKMAIG